MPDENARAIYQETCANYRAIDDFRTKLLALLPLATGAGAAFLVNSEGSESQLGPIGLFGFLVTAGLFSYELHGMKKCGSLIGVGQQLEKSLCVRGPFKSRPQEVAGFVDEPFAASVIYSASLAAWAFLALTRWSNWAAIPVSFYVFVLFCCTSLWLTRRMAYDLKSRKSYDQEPDPFRRHKRDDDLVGFVLSALPRPSARVLEVGCGAGHLARALDAAGYEVIAIDPEAPDGPIFRRTTLEELDEAGPFDAAVASYVLHHIENLHPAIDQIADLLTAGGKLVIEEFGWDRVDQATAAWYGRQQGEASTESVLPAWADEHEGLHGYEEMRRALDERFKKDFFKWRPYLYRCLERDKLEKSERAAINKGDIQAVGFRYVGTRR